MDSIMKIMEGWRNKLIPPKHLKEYIEKTAEYRLSVCKNCPKQSENAKRTGYKTIRQDVHCTACSCPLEAKTRCLSCKCPLGKWDAVATQEQNDEIKKAIILDDESKS